MPFGIVRPLRIFVPLALLAAAAACTQLLAIEPDLCGNRVLESAEDCDGAPPAGDAYRMAVCGLPETPHACHFICGEIEGAGPCPTGWRCGDDGRCRQPSGGFAFPPEPIALPATSFEAGDIDGDGITDLVGSDDRSAAVAVRFGGPTGEFSELESLRIPAPAGPVAFGRLDEDDRLDVVIPIESGLYALRGRTDRRLGPVAFPPVGLPDGTNRLVPFEADPRTPGTELLDFVGTNMRVVSLDGSPPGPSIQLPVGVAGGVIHPIATTDLDGDGRSEFALTLADQRTIWIYTSTGSVPGQSVQVRTSTQVALGAEVDRGARFADVDGDGFDDLLASVIDSAGNPRLEIAYWQRQLNTFGRPCFAELQLGTDGAFELNLPLAVGDLDGDGRADYVTEFGVFTNPNNDGPVCSNTGRPLVEVFSARASWDAATVGDLNNDQIPDVVAVSSSLGTVEVLLNLPGGFSRFVIRAEPPIRLPTFGDFDGDGVGDIAVVQSSALSPDKVLVAFGRPSGGPSSLVPMGEIGMISSVQPLDAVPGAGAPDRATDLLVLARSFPLGERRETITLYGSTERRLVAPLVLADEVGVDAPSAALVGSFCRVCPMSRECEDATDIAAIGIGGAETPEGEPIHRLWIAPGDPGAVTEAAVDSDAMTASPLPALSAFDSECAIWIAGDVDGDGWDEVLGIDGRASACNDSDMPATSRLLVVSRALPGTRCDTEVDFKIERLLSSLVRPTDARMRDMDDDGDMDLVLSFGGYLDTRSINREYRSAGVAVVWNEDGRLSADAISTAQFGLPVRSVNSVRANADAIPEVVALTSLESGGTLGEEGAFILTLSGEDRRTLDPPEVFAFTRGGLGSVVADIDGDGLADYLYGDGALINISQALPAEPLGEPTQ